MVTEGPRPMSGPLRRDVMIANPEGFHMRPAAAFAELASRFESKVTVSCGGESVDGKFWPDLLLLASKATQGASLTLEVDGRDAAAAIEALARQLASLFDEQPPGAANGSGHDSPA